MRVELIYAPGCNSYTRVRNTLETVIAEERLPIPVELVERNEETSVSPMIRINDEEHDTGIHHTIEHMRDLLCRKWKELTECALAG